MKTYQENCWAKTGGVAPVGLRSEFSFSIFEHDSLDAPTYLPSGHVVQCYSAFAKAAYTVPSLAFRG
jgi:hypothetical protein